MSKNVVITGASSGIGLEFTRHYSELGYRVFALCRQSSPELNGLAVIVVEGVDVARPEALSDLADRIQCDRVDLLINNAGVLHNENIGELNYDTIEQQFEVNAVGPLRITEALLPKLLKGSKLALITSRMGSIADNGSGSRYGYRMSKAALNAAGMSLSIDLKPRGVAVAILHPGYVQTRMVGGGGEVSTAQSVANLTSRIDELTLNNSGTFWHANGEVLPW